MVKFEIRLRRFRIVKLLGNSFLGFSFFLCIYLLFVFFSLKLESFTFLELLKFIFLAFLIVVISISRIYLKLSNYRLIFLIQLITATLVAIIIMFYFGVSQFFPWVVILTLTNSIAIIFNIRRASMYALIITVAALLIALTHNLGFYNFHVDSIDSGIANTLVLCFFLWLNVYIAKIGYEQIEHSYEQAVRYSTELEQTNSELDQRVKERTRELENSWIKNVKSLERAATMGQLTASLLHDLKSPLSSFNLSMEALRSRSKDNKEVKDLQNAYEQIIKIMEDTEGLMKDNKVEVEFDIQHQVDTAVKLMENILKKENVALRKIYKGSKTIQGSSTLFLRIILNILMNSVEELSRSNNKNKQIEISLYNNNKTQNIVIRDNGSGIPKEQMSKIFKPGYGTKMDGNHYGLGLSFVKKTVEEEFGGQISIRSEINKFTEIRIII